MTITLLDSENADRDLTSQITVLTHTPDAVLPLLCQGLVVFGDGAKDLDGSGGLFEFEISIGGQTMQAAPQQIQFSAATQASVWTELFLVPANEEVILKVKSPNAADTDVDVTAYLYSTGLPFLACPVDCLACTFQLEVTISGLTGGCVYFTDCDNYNGTWMVTQTDEDGICVWTGDISSGMTAATLSVYCEAGAWYATITSWGFTCAKWRLDFAMDPDCPYGADGEWVWVSGNCNSGKLITEAYGEFPPKWVPVGIRHGVYRMKYIR